jgi:uncharacterized membrane protein YoaT (DUF817 family)
MTAKSTLFILLLGILLLGASVMFPGYPAVLLVLYAAVSIFLLASNFRDWILFLLAAVAGLITEPLAVHNQSWIYPMTRGLFGVPFWVFLAWGAGAVSAYRIGLYLSDHKE